MLGSNRVTDDGPHYMSHSFEPHRASTIQAVTKLFRELVCCLTQGKAKR
jgi:hypothetical protein